MSVETKPVGQVAKGVSRNASPSIRGYHYQILVSIKRWLELANHESIVFEGLDDIDRFNAEDNGRVFEQVKDLTDAISVRSRAVLNTITNFLDIFHRLRVDSKSTTRFIFTTTARLAQQKLDKRLDIDVLKTWENYGKTQTPDPSERTQIANALRSYLLGESPEAPTKKTRLLQSPLLTSTVAWMEEELSRWDDFADAVKWHFEAPDLLRLEKQIGNDLELRWPLHASLPQANKLLVPYLIKQAFSIAGLDDDDARTKTRLDLERILGEATQGWSQWSTSREAQRLRETLDDCIQLGSIVEDRTRDFNHEHGRQSPASMLKAGYQVIEFQYQGRESILNRLRAWCSAERSCGVQLVRGSAGAGKTRLLIEWCQLLEQIGWHAGFVLGYCDPNLTDFGTLFKGTHPLLIVVDRAEGKERLVKTLFERMASKVLDGKRPKLRCVVLARHQPDWWDKLGIVEEIAIESPLSLEPVYRNANERLTAFRDAHQVFSSFLDSEALETDDGYDFEKPPFDRALYVHMAALAAAKGQSIRDAEDLLKWVLQYERVWWDKEIQGDNGLNDHDRDRLQRSVDRAMAALTLVRGVRDVDKAESLFAVVDTSGPGGLNVPGYLATLARRLYGGGEGIEGVEPDMLGELLVKEVLERDPRFVQHLFLEAPDTESRLQILAGHERLFRQRSELSIWDRPRALTTSTLEWLPLVEI